MSLREDPSLLAADIASQPALLGTPRQAGAVDAARELVGSRAVTRLVGIGSSHHVATFGAACWEVLGGRVATVLAAPGGGVPQPRLGPDDALVVVSQSGATPALLELCAQARRGGAAVLAVTNTPGSALEGLADLTLGCDAGPEHVVPATKSVTTAMLLLRRLAAPLPAAALAGLQHSVDALLADPPRAGASAPVHVVAGGLAGQAVAEEVALKLAEVAGLAVVPESLVDYLHGPVAVRGPVLALLDADDPNASALLTDGLLRPVVQPTGDPALDRIAWVVAGQLFALDAARQRGVDPDDRRGLSKVTLSR